MRERISLKDSVLNFHLCQGLTSIFQFFVAFVMKLMTLSIILYIFRHSISKFERPYHCLFSLLLLVLLLLLLFLSRTIRSIDWTQTGTKTLRQSISNVMAMKDYYTIFRSQELEPHQKVQFGGIPRTPLWLESYPSAKDTVSTFKTPMTGWTNSLKYDQTDTDITKKIDRYFDFLISSFSSLAFRPAI